MRDYNFYRKNNKTEYDETLTDLYNLKPTERIVLKCIECQRTYTNAYKCTNYLCPLFGYKTGKLKRPHTCSDKFLKIRKNFNWLEKREEP